MLAVCTLSHVNDDPERGFSTNKHILSVHGTLTNQKTIETLRLVKDYLNLHGGRSKIKVCKDLIKRCSMTRQHYEENLKGHRALKKDKEEAKKEKTEKEEARQKCKLLELEPRNDLECTNKNLKLSNTLLNDGESELESMTKAEKVDKKYLLSASVKISTSVKCCALLQSEQEMLGVVTIAMICSTLASFRKFQYFQRPIYNPVEHL